MQDDFQELVEKVDRERADKVARFLEMLRDPDLAGYVARLRNGTPQPEPAKIASKAASFTPPAGFKSGNGIREAVRSLTLPAQFTADDVLRGLETHNFAFASEDHKSPVRDAIYSLTHGNAPVFRRVSGGVGGLPSRYERV
jgi:hypothetical protein